MGSFICINHVGPSKLGNGYHPQIGEHPHVYLSLLAHLCEEQIVHVDSRGAEQARVVLGRAIIYWNFVSSSKE
ncbi:MAG: hypothetical protein AAF519_05990 [Bacteroidota bacterium]